MADVFLSYAREDRDTASRLVTALQATGWSVWWDARITAGQEFPPAIRGALEAARCVVVLWSSSSIRSSYVEAEAIRARDRGVLLPASLDDVQVPVPFNTLQTVSLARWKGGHEENVGYGALLDTVVSWTLSRTANGTRLRLVHAGFVVPRNKSAFEIMSGGWKKVVSSLGAIAGEQD